MKDGRSRVYFLRDGDHIKIGTSANVPVRILGGQTMNPRELVLIGSVPGDRRLEADLHLKFRHLHVRGEWFAATPELLAFIDGLRYAARPEQSERCSRKGRRSVQDLTSELLSCGHRGVQEELSTPDGRKLHRCVGCGAVLYQGTDRWVCPQLFVRARNEGLAETLREMGYVGDDLMSLTAASR
jgi:hypothetical protein